MIVAFVATTAAADRKIHSQHVATGNAAGSSRDPNRVASRRTCELTLKLVPPPPSSSSANVVPPESLRYPYVSAPEEPVVRAVNVPARFTVTGYTWMASASSVPRTSQVIVNGVGRFFARRKHEQRRSDHCCWGC